MESINLVRGLRGRYKMLDLSQLEQTLQRIERLLANARTQCPDQAGAMDTLLGPCSPSLQRHREDAMRSMLEVVQCLVYGTASGLPQRLRESTRVSTSVLDSLRAPSAELGSSLAPGQLDEWKARIEGVMESTHVKSSDAGKIIEEHATFLIGSIRCKLLQANASKDADEIVDREVSFYQAMILLWQDVIACLEAVIELAKASSLTSTLLL